MLLQTNASGVTLAWAEVFAGFAFLATLASALVAWVKINERHKSKLEQQEKQVAELFDLQEEAAKQIQANSVHIGKVSGQLDTMKQLLEAGVYPKPPPT